MERAGIRVSPHRGGPSSSKRSHERAMLPAIVFIFSRAACDDAVAQCLRDGLRLTEPEQRAEIRRICEEHTEGISDEELRALDYGPWSAALEAGVAAHHAGMVPAFREAVEECFASGLLRLVYATETLALGINMPARTVVIERLTKVREHGRSALTSGEYAQLTGQGRAKGARRARPCGRRLVPAGARERARGTRHFAGAGAALVVQAYLQPGGEPRQAVSPSRRAKEVLDKSFAQFQDTRHSDALSARLDRILEVLEQQGSCRRCDDWRLTPIGPASRPDLPRVRPAGHRGSGRRALRRSRRSRCSRRPCPPSPTRPVRGAGSPSPASRRRWSSASMQLVSAADVAAGRGVRDADREEPEAGAGVRRGGAPVGLGGAARTGSRTKRSFSRRLRAKCQAARGSPAPARGRGAREDTAQAAREAADSIQRGVVAAGWVGALPVEDMPRDRSSTTASR